MFIMHITHNTFRTQKVVYQSCYITHISRKLQHKFVEIIVNFNASCQGLTLYIRKMMIFSTLGPVVVYYVHRVNLLCVGFNKFSEQVMVLRSTDHSVVSFITFLVFK